MLSSNLPSKRICRMDIGKPNCKRYLSGSRRRGTVLPPIKLDTFGADFSEYRKAVRAHAATVLKLGRREVAQRGVDPLVHGDVVQEPAQLEDSIIVARVLGQVNFLLRASWR